jgi:holo-[acyl-carrier protein] synthase
MIIGIGTDIVEIARVQDSIERYGERFLQRVFTEQEREYCETQTLRMLSYAARFAAKEACAKALGTGIREDVGFRAIEVRRSAQGKPFIALHGSLAERMESCTIHCTLSHSAVYAVAFVVIEGAR